MIAQEAGFNGANLKIHRRFLPPGLGVQSLNQKPSEEGDFRPWREPLTVSGPNIPSGRQTMYRLGRDTASSTNYWFSWTSIVHAIRAFDSSDPTERTYYTGDGAPKWTDNIIGVATAPYPTAFRLLAVPAPTVPPVVTLNTNGSTGDTRQLYYCYTRVNDIGWESAPSPAFLAPTAIPGAILDLSYSEAVPAGNYGVDRVRWYRTNVIGSTDAAEFFFIREYAIGASGQQDDARALGQQLATEDWLALDTTATWLTDCWSAFASALVGKAVRFCEPNYVYAWPIAYEYILADTPIAQAAFAQRLLVFTTAGATLFTGSDPGAMDQKTMRLAPLVSQRSLVVGETFCMWAAKDGLWYYGADGYKCLTAGSLKKSQWEALVPTTIAGYLLQLDERTLYVGFYNDGALKGFVVDPLNPNGVYFLTTGYGAGYWDPLQRKLFVLDGSTLKEWDAGEAFMTATWAGKVNRQQAYIEGEWMEMLASGNVTVKVFTENSSASEPDSAALIERMSRTVTSGLLRLPDGIGGRDWQLQFSTAGSLQALGVE